MRTERGPRLDEVKARGVSVIDYGNGCGVECLVQKFPIEQRYVWLEVSQTIGLELRVVRNEVDRPLATLLLRPDRKALVWGDREFKRTVDDAGFDDTCAEFLREAADHAAVALPTVKYRSADRRCRYSKGTARQRAPISPLSETASQHIDLLRRDG